MSVVAVGDQLVQQQHFGAERIQERLQDTLANWNHLLDLAALRRKRLEEAVDFHQVISAFILGFKVAEPWYNFPG